jgi:hypothetical protein
MKPDYGFSTASMLHALHTGVDFLRSPQATWAQVQEQEQRSPAGVRGVLLGYALWWIVAVVLVGWVVQVAVDVYNDGVPVPQQVLMGLGSAVLAGFSALGATLGMAAAVVLMVHKNRHSLVRWPDALQLAAYGMTPVWLALMVHTAPELGGLALLAGVGYGLYAVWQVLGQLAWLPADKRESFMLGMAVAAMVVTVLYSLLGVLTVVVGFLALVVKYQAKAAEQDIKANNPSAHEEWRRETAAQRDDASPDSATQAATRVAPPEPDTFAQPEAPAIPPPIAPAPGLHSAKITALDKKISAATAQGDMAEVVRLMGERSAALQGAPLTSDQRS